MVSTILCPRCKTKNSKKADVCYKCKNQLKARKNPSILSSNPKSKIELKIILVGVIIFVSSNILLVNIALDYVYMISGFAAMFYLYLAFKNSPMFQDSTKKNLKSAGFKIILNYLIIVVLGIITLFGLGFV